MPAEEERPVNANFWTTLPGILTGVAAIVTAVGGLIVGLYQYGVLGSKEDNANPRTIGRTHESAESNGATNSGAILVNPSKSGVSSGVDQPTVDKGSSATRSAQQALQKNVVITKSDGSVDVVKPDSLVFLNSSGWIELENGYSIPMPGKIMKIDVIDVVDEKARLRITLKDGKTVEGFSRNADYPLKGENDLGTLRIETKQVRRLTFPD
jgi:hypothetical protein